VLRKDRDIGRHEVGVRGCLLAVVIIHEWIAVGTYSYNYGSTYAKHLHHEDDIMFVSWVIFRGIILGPHISNDPSFRQKHPGVPDGSDGSDGTSYPLTENHTLPVAQATGRIARLPCLLFGDVYAPSERHMCYTLRSGCSYAEAVLHNAWRCLCLSPAAASLGMLVLRLEIIATTYCSTLFKTYAFSLYSHLCIYVSI